MSVIRNETLKHMYRDSVVLMELSRGLTRLTGVEGAAVMMGTPANLAVLGDSGLLEPCDDKISADDIVLAVRAVDENAALDAIEWGRNRLTSARGASGLVSHEVTNGDADVYRGWRQVPDHVRLALISTPGPYAAAEAWKALRRGLHVFMFSDHVAVADEVALKAAGRERGLLVMGPECGTSLIGRVPLGFSNVVKPGPIGLVAASGSGLQETMCLIDRMGSGVTQAIGTGGRDLSPAVGGAGMRQGIELLQADPATQVLVLISKPPDRQVAEEIIAAARRTRKPVVACFLGQRVEEIDNVHSAETLEAAALMAVKLAGVEPDQEEDPLVSRPLGSGLLRGFFAGGTLAYEAMVVLRDRVGPILSNKPLSPAHRWNGMPDVEGHLCLDLGSEEYTTGKPHPMLDPSAQADLITDALGNQRVSVILFDVVIGTGSHSDPAGKLIAAIEEGRRRAISASSGPSLVASVTGTDADLQCRGAQAEKLSRAGVIVAPSNASAARSAAALLGARDPVRIS